jgi:hypothetical protein
MQVLKTAAAGFALATMSILATSETPNVAATDATTTCVTLTRLTSILAGSIERRTLRLCLARTRSFSLMPIHLLLKRRRMTG